VQLRDITAPMGAIVALALGVYELTQPADTRRLSPLILFAVAALFAARIAARRQLRKREEVLKAVPPKPLGLDEDSSKPESKA